MVAKKSLIEKFWNKINRSGKCWIWTGCVNNGGYGTFGLNGKYTMAHRFSWEFYNNQKIPLGYSVMHTCDNPRCVNPKHLTIGTMKDNMQDSKKKGRSCFGEKNAMAKLTETQVLEIKSLIKSNLYLIKDIAIRYNVSHRHVLQIKNGVRWRYLNATE